MATIELEAVEKRYGHHCVVAGVSARIADGELVVLVGPSGCGKTTLLRIIAGLVTPTRGVVRIDGRDVTHAAPGERDIAMVFQSYALYPHMTVLDNIAFPLRVRHVPPKQIEARVREVAALLGLSDLLARRPAELSGGQRQRVAMGRAIVREPKAFLFDEPLSNLDAALRSRMRAEIALLHRRLGATMIYVTHDQHEAMTLADRLILLQRGAVVEEGAPLQVFERPRTRFAAEFLGGPPMAFLPVTRVGEKLAGDSFTVPLAALPGLPQNLPEKLWLGVRPEAWRPAADGLPAVVEWVERTGGDTHVYARIGSTPIVARWPGDSAALAPEQRLTLGFARARLFARDTGLAVEADPP